MVRMLVPRYRYVKVSSLIHGLDAASKGIWLLAVNVLAFLLPDPFWLGLLFLSAVLVGLLANLGWRRLFEAMKPLKSFVLFLLFGPLLIATPALLTYPSLQSVPLLVAEGLDYGLMLCVRFGCMMYSGLIFLMATKPKDFINSLMRIGLPYRYGFALISVFSLIPTFEAEANIIKYAQMSRGLDYSGCKCSFIRKTINYFNYTLKPLLISSLRRADMLAISMDSGCFGAYKSRTSLHENKMDGNDAFFILVVISLSLLATYGTLTGYIRPMFDFSTFVKSILRLLSY